jgi:hypothetical protein
MCCIEIDEAVPEVFISANWNAQSWALDVSSNLITRLAKIKTAFVQRLLVPVNDLEV